MSTQNQKLAIGAGVAVAVAAYFYMQKQGAPAAEAPKAAAAAAAVVAAPAPAPAKPTTAAKKAGAARAAAAGSADPDRQRVEEAIAAGDAFVPAKTHYGRREGYAHKTVGEKVGYFKKENRAPKASAANAKFKIGDKVQVKAGADFGWFDGEVTGPGVTLGNGNIIYKVRRHNNKADPNRTGKVKESKRFIESPVLENLIRPQQ
jgi:hypothetical protein